MAIITIGGGNGVGGGRGVLSGITMLLLLMSLAHVSGVESNDTLQYRYICPKTFASIGRKCYRFSNNTATWFQAYFSCRDLRDSNLTIVAEKYDQRQLEQFLFRGRSRSGTPNLNSFWVGGFKDWNQKRWIYTDGSLMRYPQLKDINFSEQDMWTCLLIDGNLKRWRAENCMEQRPFACETKPIASIAVKLTDRKTKRRITIDDCVSNTNSLTKRQRKRCWRLLEGSGTATTGFDEPAAVIQQAKPAYSSKPDQITALTHICPQNWMSLGNQCYLFSKEKATWLDAHFNCGQINAKLAIVKSKVQDQKLRIFLNGFTEKQERWIGGRYNVKTRQWIWALNGKPLKYKGFVKGAQEVEEGLNWQAIVMDPQHGYKWTHREETEKHLYVCQVKGRAVKRLNYGKKLGGTVEIVPNGRYDRRRANRNKRI